MAQHDLNPAMHDDTGLEDGDPDQLQADLHPPPILVKVTGYRIFTTACIASFGIAKAVLTYKGQSAAPTTLDWVLGVLIMVGLYFMGLYESVEPPVFKWFFHRDYGRDILAGLKAWLGPSEEEAV